MTALRLALLVESLDPDAHVSLRTQDPEVIRLGKVLGVLRVEHNVARLSSHGKGIAYDLETGKGRTVEEIQARIEAM